MHATSPQLALIRKFAGVVVVGLLALSCSGSVAVDQVAPASETERPARQEQAATGPDEGSPDETSAPTPFSDDDAVPLPVDPDVSTGVLDNGLTYYIRHNDAPGRRAELRLAVNAGSLQEDSDQSGVAHFLEHMLFNGTEKYPSNELVAVLEAFGSKFGPDVNAYTSYDETVYELSIPTDDSALVDQALDVLREWADRAVIDPDEVDAEVGVVVEEWRLRDQGIGGRIAEIYDQLLATGTPYEGRAPIGELGALEVMSADTVHRFYRDWYRPDLMAVVVVGDLDVDAVEELIEKRFGDLPVPDRPRERSPVSLSPNDEVEIVRLADPELPTAYIEAIFAGPQAPLRTVGDYRRALAYDVGAHIIDARLREDVVSGEAPYLAAYTSTTELARDLATPGLLAEAAVDDLEPAFELLMTEVARIRRDGFGDAEFDRAAAAFDTALEQAYAGRETTQDVEYARRYVNHFLAHSPMMGWDDQLSLERRLLDEMTPEYVAGVYLETIDASEPEIVMVGPAADADAFPTDDAIIALLATGRSPDVPRRTDTRAAPSALMEPPPPADIATSTRNEQLGSEVIGFANGVTVLLKPTEIALNQIALTASSPGGTSVLSEEQLAAAFVAPGVVTTSGVGGLDQVELDRLLAEESVSVGMSPDTVEESLTAVSSPESAELMLQLVHQYVTEPRAEQSALAAVVAELEPFAEQPDQIPEVASSNALARARYGDGRRFRFLPSVGELRDLTVDDVTAVFEQMYADSGDLTVAIVGDFDLAKMRDLAARYLGTLPGDGQPDPWVDHQAGPPSGVTERLVQAGQDPQGRVTMLFTAETETDQTTQIRLQILENLISTRLRDQLREALGAAYAPIAVLGSVERPDPLIETYVEVSGDPERLDAIVEETRSVLEDLRGGGLGEVELQTAREQVRRDLELVSNSFWTSQMLYAHQHPDIRMLTVNERVRTAASTTLVDLQAIIDVVLVDDHIVVKLVPGP